MRKRSIACVLFVLCLPLLAACSRQEPPPPAKKPPVEKLLIGLIPEQNLFKQMERYEPLGEYLSRKTGTKITFKILPRYGNIIDTFKSSGLDGAFFGSFTYTLAHAKVGVEVLARPVALDNTSTYHGMIFVRKDSRIRTARDMKGKRFAFVDKATTAGYLLPLEYFHEHGISDYNALPERGLFHRDARGRHLRRAQQEGRHRCGEEYGVPAACEGRPPDHEGVGRPRAGPPMCRKTPSPCGRISTRRCGTG